MISNSNTGRTGVILAAGFGSRLKGTVEDIDLKPLTPVAGIPLIFRVIESLSKAGCSKIVIVLGHGHEEIKKDIEQEYDGPNELVYVYNDEFHLKNGVSLLAARQHLEGEFVLTMADHIVSDSIMYEVRKHRPPAGGATLLVDYKVDSIFDIDDATKVLADGRELVAIGKEIEKYNCIDTGVFVCTPGLLNVLGELFEENGDASLSEGVQRLAEYDKMDVLDVGDGFWQDVDTPEMLEQAEEMLKIESTISS